ncbi:Sensor histidine kinase RcsC [Paenibacillus solanacearum]|uniref:Circadian input-output histidine kinase CikA n=1 Tax=Paenibacillus solanacearum TaxID=2048548 RepID=A0A916NJS0_9BACL|nr:CHASE3 domain-containing protein [Paenibacillus solanacearum]CAG7638633.1 Sensor histidine kinase RcsC [Paenibacillus solanacearum]
MLQKAKYGIRFKIILGYAVITVFFIISILIVNSQVSSMQEQRNYIIEHDIAVFDLTNQIEKHMLDMETSQRGFVLTGDPAYLEPYTNASSSWKEDYTRLYAMLPDNPEQQKKLELIRSTIQHWITVAGDPTIVMKKENKTQELDAFFKSDPGKKDMDEVRAQFKAFRSTVKELTLDRADKLDQMNRTLVFGFYALMALVLLIASGVAASISSSIVRTLREVTEAITEIASSKQSHRRIPVSTQDEIGMLGEATNALLESHEREYWLQTKVGEVVTMIQGMPDTRTLGGKLISHIAPLLNATYGVIYIVTGKAGQQRIVKLASYASSGENAGFDGFRVGEGLVGQCVLENRMFHLTDVPVDYIHISSGLGKASPKDVLIAPIAYEGQVIAVLELATLETFAPEHLQLLEDIIESLGIMINSVESRTEVERLLRESQAMTEELQTQAEELQTQQEELRVTNEQLEKQNRFAEEKAQELDRIRVELEEYTEQLQQSSQYKSDFLANMSHELRTPLNSIIILSEMLSENKKRTLTAEEQEYARIVHSSGNDLLSLINDILDLSKVEAGKIDIVVDEMNVTELPAHMSKQFMKVAEQKSLQFMIELAPDVPTIFLTDEQRVHQILRNLLSNAFKFTERGSVTMRVQTAEPKLVKQLFSPQRHDTVLALSVSDTGIGIPADKREVIFEAFHQADGTTSRKFGGTGLGLSICREFAKLLGGHIVVESEEGVGTNFTLYVPSLEPNKQRHIHETAVSFETDAPAAVVPVSRLTPAVPPSTLFAGKHILVVDDDVRNVFALTTWLEDAGFHVTVASNGQECLDALNGDVPIDLALIDIMMPVMDGYETIRRIRANPQLAALPIIALTAKAMKHDREQCLEAGASDYISKPINMNQLTSLMRVWLAKE